MLEKFRIWYQYCQVITSFSFHFNILEKRILDENGKMTCTWSDWFDFASHWLKSDSFKPITKRSNRNRVITFDSHLKTALSTRCLSFKVYNFQVPKRSDFIKFHWTISGRCSSTWYLLQAYNLCRNALSWTNQELFDFPCHYSVLPTAMILIINNGILFGCL